MVRQVSFETPESFGTLPYPDRTINVLDLIPEAAKIKTAFLSAPTAAKEADLSQAMLELAEQDAVGAGGEV